MIYACGMRVSEIINCKLESFDADEAFVRVRGKGDKTRLVPIGTSALDALKAYLDHGRPKLVKPGTKSHIFLTVRGRPLTRERVRQILQERARAAGIDQHVFPHILRPFIRHAFAGERRGPPHHPGDAGTFGHRHHADLHASGTATAEFHPSPFSSQRMMPLLGTTFQQGKSS